MPKPSVALSQNLCALQWGSIAVIVVNSPVLGKCAKNVLEQFAGTVIGGWLGYAFYLATSLRHRAWLPVVSVIYAFLAAIAGTMWDLQGAANLSIITLVSGNAISSSSSEQ